MSKNLLAFASSPADFSFCMRLRQGLSAKGFRLMLLTPKPSLVARSYVRRTPCMLVRNSDNDTADLHVGLTAEVLAKEIGEREAARYYFGVREILERVHRDEGISAMFVRNGNSVPAKAMALFAQQNGIATLYYEPAGIQGKLFVDPRGVDAQSLLFQKPEILDRFPVDAGEFDRWRESYLERRAEEKSFIPDAAFDHERTVATTLDSIAGLFYALPFSGRAKVRHAAAVQYDEYDTQNGAYNFFPMQASSDSQVLFNSSVNLPDALDIAYNKSREQQRDLLIQPHPHERKQEMLDLLSSMRGRKGVFIVNGAPYGFVVRCRELITINAALGTDARLAGKSVTFLGASYIAQLNDDRLRSFLLGYLLDIDYFSSGSIALRQIEAMLSRLVLQ